MPDDPEQRFILIVEDDPDLRLVHSEILQEEGYAVLTAADGAEALDLIHRAGPPALILLDLRMPKLNGWDFVRHLRRHDHLNEVPFIVVAAHYQIAEEAAALGATAWLQKPVGIDELLSAVDHAYAEQTAGGRS